MAKHKAVAERFHYFLSAVDLSREQFVTAVDHAITSQSLYSVLNGNRRPSRALAVLIERTWGFRVDYLLNGNAPIWCDVEKPTGRLQHSPDEQAILETISRSSHIARAFKRDLDDTVLWSDLWQRVQSMLQDFENRNEPGTELADADFAHLVFADCQWTSQRFEALVNHKLKRRSLHLTSVFIERYLSDVAPTPFTKPMQNMLAEAEEREAELRNAEEHIRQQLTERLKQPTPTEALASGVDLRDADAFALHNSVANAIDR